MSKARSEFLKEAALRYRVSSEERDLRDGKIVRVGDSDFTMTPEDLESFKKDLASKGLEIAPICNSDSRMYMPDGKTEIGLRCIQNAAVPAMSLQKN